MKQVQITSRGIPSKPRSQYRTGGTTTTIMGGGGTDVDLSAYMLLSRWLENFEERTDASGTPYLYAKKSIVSVGGITMYATEDVVVPSIFDGIPLDNKTIWKNPTTGKIEVIGGTGGSFDESAMWAALAGETSQQINKSHLTTVLAEYATAESVSALTTELNKKWTQDDTKIKNWDTAFGWGDHSKAGYAHLANEEAFTGLKHFTAGLSVGESKKKIYEENGVVYIDADVAVTGAMTFYASAGRSVSTIMDGVTVDEETITKGSDNVLRIKNAGAGSSFDENAMWSALSGSSDNQINKSHLTTALDGYATQNWVIENYATKSELSAVSNKLNDFLEGSDTDNIINKWKELEAFLSGMAETDNLAEILETKADKKYVDSTFVTLGTKQTITGEKTFSSVLNTAAIKASGAITAPSLAVSDWVTIAGIKLRKLEDGALMLEGNLALTGALTMYASNGQSFDTIYDGLPIDNDTIYWQEVDGSRVLKAKEGSGSSFDKSAMWTALAGSTTEQINKSHLTTALTGYATESWVTSKNYAVKATTLAGYGITDGINAVSVTGTGNAITAASISGHTLTLTKGSTFSLSGHKHAWADITSGKPTTLAGYGITDAYTKTESDSKYPTKTGSGASGTWGINVTGNAETATKLQTARSLWGNNFDGTANISGDITLGFGKGIYCTSNDERWLLQTKRSDNTHINGIKTNGFQMCMYYGDVNTMRFEPSRIYSYVDFRAERDLYINGIRLHKTADGVLTLEGNLAVTGGVTMYATSAQDVASIYDGIPIDNDTIYWETVDGKKVLKAKGGGEAGSVSWDNISGRPSVFATNIANITDLHSSWDAVLAAQKPAWLTAVSIATISDLNSGWDALLKAAPSAYVTRWPTISEVTGKQNLVVKLNGGTTEGTNQFTYNATGAKTINITPAGIGAAASSHSHNAISASLTGANTLNMVYAKVADNDYFRLRVGGTASNAGYVEFATSDDGNEPIYFRQYTGTFTTVRRTLTLLDGSGNSSFPGTVTAPTFNGKLAWSHITSKPTTLSGYGITDAPTKTGSGASGTWGIAITGNAGSASKLQTPRSLWGNDFDGTGPITGKIIASNGIYLPYTVKITNQFGDILKTDYDNSSGYNDYFEITAIGSNKIGKSLTGGNSGLLTWGGNRFIFNSYGVGWYAEDGEWMRTYNSLYVPKNIQCKGNIDCNSNVNCQTLKAYALDIAYGTNFKFVRMSWNGTSGDVASFFVPGSTSQWFTMELRSNGVLYTNGNILATGGGTFYGSDIRYKSIIQQIKLSLLDIAEAPSFVYHWNKEGMKCDRLNLGGSAQYTQSVLPWAVEDNDNFLSMDYATVAYTFAVHTARHLLTYETRTDKKIKKLEREIVILKKQLKKLGYEEVRTLDDQ